jgi:hypothetical protein
MVYEEYLGSDELVNQISAVLESHHNLSPEFIVVPPGGLLQQDMFLDPLSN